MKKSKLCLYILFITMFAQLLFYSSHPETTYEKYLHKYDTEKNPCLNDGVYVNDGLSCFRSDYRNFLKQTFPSYRNQGLNHVSKIAKEIMTKSTGEQVYGVLLEMLDLYLDYVDDEYLESHFSLNYLISYITYKFKRAESVGIRDSLKIYNLILQKKQSFNYVQYESRFLEIKSRMMKLNII